MKIRDILSCILVLAMCASTGTAVNEYTWGDIFNIAKEKIVEINLTEEAKEISEEISTKGKVVEDNGSYTIGYGNYSFGFSGKRLEVATGEKGVNLSLNVTSFGEQVQTAAEKGLNLSLNNSTAFANNVIEKFKNLTEIEGNESLTNSTVFTDISGLFNNTTQSNEEVGNFNRPIRAANISSLML